MYLFSNSSDRPITIEINNPSFMEEMYQYAIANRTTETVSKKITKLRLQQTFFIFLTWH